MMSCVLKWYLDLQILGQLFTVNFDQFPLSVFIGVDYGIGLNQQVISISTRIVLLKQVLNYFEQQYILVLPHTYRSF